MPANLALRALRQLEVVDDWPPLDDSAFIIVPVGASTADVVASIERTLNWTYFPSARSFMPAMATHRSESPDAAGFRTGDPLPGLRPVILVKIRFRRLAGGLDLREPSLSASGVFNLTQSLVTPGDVVTFGVVSERSFFLSSRSAEDADFLVESSREVVEAGLTFNGLVGLLPAGMARVDAEVNFSAFGSGIDRTAVPHDIDLDIPVGEWVAVLEVDGVEASVALALSNVQANATGEHVRMEIYIETALQVQPGLAEIVGRDNDAWLAEKRADPENAGRTDRQIIDKARNGAHLSPPAAATRPDPESVGASEGRGRAGAKPSTSPAGGESPEQNNLPEGRSE